MIKILTVLCLLAAECLAAENLKLNPHLDYSSDSHDGALITGDNLDNGVVAGKVNYVLMYGEACFNSKRQARRTVELYSKYRDRVNFVIIDLDTAKSSAQQQIIQRFYRGYIPHVVVLNATGNAVYNASGEVDSERIEKIFASSLSGK